MKENMNHQEYRIRALLNPYIWLHPANLTSSEKEVLLAIIFLCDREATELAYKEVADYLKMDIRAVQRVISRLCEKNLIKRIRKMMGNIYIFNWEKADIFKPIFDKKHTEFFDKICLKKVKLFFNVDYYITNVNNNQISFPNTTIVDLEKKVSLKKYLPRLRRRGKDSIPWYDELIKPNQPLPKAEPPRNVPREVKALIEYWKFVGLPVSKDTTKSYHNDILAIKRLLNGRMFEGQRFSMEQIKKAITDFSGAALDPNYEPGNTEIKSRLAKYHINTFIMNHYARNGDRSLFLRYLKEPPKRIIPLLADKNPAITNRLKDFYLKRIIKKQRAISDIDENKFREATAKLVKFIKKPEISRCLRYIDLADRDIANLLCECVAKEAKAKDKIPTPGWFCSDITFDNVLPKFFRDQGLMEASHEDPQEYTYEELY